MGLIGIALIFLPNEALSFANVETNQITLFLIQVVGAAYFAFGMLNWMSKRSLIGGIYNRPIAIANLSHFMIVGLAMAKVLSGNLDVPPVLWAAGLLYILFAALFGLILFTHPIADA